jgi:intergrase/recombinase
MPKAKTKTTTGSDSNQRPPPCQGLLSNEISSIDDLVFPDRSYIKSSKKESSINCMVNGPEFWSGFQSYLNINNNHLGTRDRLNYAMKSLSALSKYTGSYDRWQRIRQSFQLRWSNGDSLQAFNSIFNKEKDLDHMLCWLKDACSKLPQKYANVLIFNTLTGLRPSEAYLSIRLIHNNMENYLNDDTKILEHFKFSDFIRRTKKAYISIVNDQILEIARSSHKEVSYNQLKFQFKREGIGAIHMLFCRKIFATYLRIQRVEQEIIALLQGRIPRNVFVRHYFRPNFAKENEKVNISLECLYKQII